MVFGRDGRELGPGSGRASSRGDDAPAGWVGTGGPRAVSVGNPARDGDGLLADPFGAFPAGAFFGGRWRGAPGRAIGGMRGSSVDLALPLRHVASEATLARLREVLGPSGAPLLEAWRDLWERLAGGRVEALAARLGYHGLDTWSRRPDDGVEDVAGLVADRLRQGRGGAFEASRLFAMERRREAPHVRDPVLHAVEDAAMAVALERAGASWGYVASSPWRRGLFELSSRSGGPKAGRGRVRAMPACRARSVEASVLRNPAYWRVAAFASACPRPMRVAEDARHAAAILLDMARQGHARAFAKHCEAKRGTWTIDLAGVVGIGDALAALARAMGEDAFGADARGEGGGGRGRGGAGDAGDGFLLMQAFRRFEREARFFVVDGRVVASTPSDRFLSPLDAHEGPGRLDPRVAVLLVPPGGTGPYDRGMTRSETDRRLVAAMARRVRALCAAARLDPGGGAALGRAHIVDVGAWRDPDAAPGAEPAVEVIEVNRWRGAGIYAVRCDRLVAAATPPGRRRDDGGSGKARMATRRGSRHWTDLRGLVEGGAEGKLGAALAEAMEVLGRQAAAWAPDER